MKSPNLKSRVFNTNKPGKFVQTALNEGKILSDALAKTRQRMGKFFVDNQFLGRKRSIGCVSLEISQRCNLNCSLCYLSENANDVADIPLPELLKRLDEIRINYGVGTNVQISGGDPTLRDRGELLEIVRYARNIGLQPALFTNGIKCPRDLLEELAECGLSDVAFHVDLTQKRNGYQTEEELNAVRREYIERARGLPIMVIFNTTVFEDNFHELPKLIEFFVSQADMVGMASFQLQAETGRGELRERHECVSLESVQRKIDIGSKTNFPWNSIIIGHPECHSYSAGLVVNGNVYPLLNDEKLIGDFLRDFGHVHHDRRDTFFKIGMDYLKADATKPGWYFKLMKFFLPKLWQARRDIFIARGKMSLISFFAHNFMDASCLDPERIDACSFMVMSPDGPVSMCAHNAKRDDFVLRPLDIHTDEGVEKYIPLSKN
jgi:MoaA/NifB/PqqE/SkfB family radical SAM enzyme